LSTNSHRTSEHKSIIFNDLPIHCGIYQTGLCSMSTGQQPSLRTENPAWKSMMRLGQRLRSIRLSRNLTQAQLAKDHFSISYVSGVERGQIRPSLGALEQLAGRLEVPLVELATEGGFESHSHFLAVRSSETVSERHRQEADQALREAQIFTYQRKSDEAMTRLLGVERAHLTPRQTVLLELLLAACYNQQGRAEEARQAAQEALPEAEKAGEQDLAVRPPDYTWPSLFAPTRPRRRAGAASAGGASAAR
jgi:transcriptional regulator with XRE-family HTH domain